GGVKCWGGNQSGMLGNGSTTFSDSAIDVVGLSSGVKALATLSSSHACVIMNDGSVKCWGSNKYGQLGDGPTTDRSTPAGVVGLGGQVSSVATSETSTCALTQAGGVKCWGNNEIGTLGNGTTGSTSSPVDVVGLTSGVAALTMGDAFACVLMDGTGPTCGG